MKPRLQFEAGAWVCREIHVDYIWSMFHIHLDMKPTTAQCVIIYTYTVYMYVNIYIYIYIFSCIYIYIHTNINLSLCICIHIMYTDIYREREREIYILNASVVGFMGKVYLNCCQLDLPIQVYVGAFQAAKALARLGFAEVSRKLEFLRELGNDTAIQGLRTPGPQTGNPKNMVGL